MRRRVLPPAPRSLRVLVGEVQPDVVKGVGPVAAYADPSRGVVHLNPGTDPFTTAHETAHVFDGQVLSDGDRHFFTRLLGLNGPWVQGTGMTAAGQRSPNEFFADYYAAEATGFNPKVDGSPGSYVQSFGRRRLRRFAAALERLQAREGLPDYRRPRV